MNSLRYGPNQARLIFTNFVYHTALAKTPEGNGSVATIDFRVINTGANIETTCSAQSRMIDPATFCDRSGYYIRCENQKDKSWNFLWAAFRFNETDNQLQYAQSWFCSDKDPEVP
jgi:hypothetical protein